MAGKCTRHLFRNDQNGKRNSERKAQLSDNQRQFGELQLRVWAGEATHWLALSAPCISIALG